MASVLITGADPASSWAAASAYGVRYLVVTPQLAARHGAALAALQRRPDLRLAHLTGEGSAKWVAVFEIVPKAR